MSLSLHISVNRLIIVSFEHIFCLWPIFNFLRINCLQLVQNVTPAPRCISHFSLRPLQRSRVPPFFVSASLIVTSGDKMTFNLDNYCLRWTQWGQEAKTDKLLSLSRFFLCWMNEGVNYNTFLHMICVNDYVLDFIRASQFVSQHSAFLS